MRDGNAGIAQIRAWAGETIFKRGQSYELRGKVRELAATSEGELLAWVQGSERYATRVSLGSNRLASDCTCPYGGTCKHAIAVALAYLNRPEKAPLLPVAAANDTRFALLERKAAALALATQPAQIPIKTSAGADPEPTLQAFLAAHTQNELVALLIGLAQRFPEVREALAVRQMLANDNADQLEAEVLGRIITATAQPAWYNGRDEWYQPDYSPIYDGLTLLLNQGHADAVVRLGEHLLEAGISQVEQSHDDGETAISLASSLPPGEQLMWAIDALLRDPYDLCRGAHDVLALPFPTDAWSSVADNLLSRLNSSPAAGNFTQEYQHGRVIDFAILALEEAGRDQEIIPLCLQEAAAGRGYQRLVGRLLDAGRSTEAEQWARTGIAATARQHPGIAGSLREVLYKLRSEANDWAMVAALHAESFFDSPSLASMQALMAAAERAGVVPAVRAAAMHYLESGQLPQRMARQAGNTAIPAWPLPETGIPPTERRFPLQFPQLRLLIELAISEGRRSGRTWPRHGSHKLTPQPTNKRR